MDSTMQEIEAIKVQMYNETKNMTSKEQCAFFNNLAFQAAEEYGFTLKFRGRRNIRVLSSEAGTKD